MAETGGGGTGGVNACEEEDEGNDGDKDDEEDEIVRTGDDKEEAGWTGPALSSFGCIRRVSAAVFASPSGLVRLTPPGLPVLVSRR